MASELLGFVVMFILLWGSRNVSNLILSFLLLPSVVLVQKTGERSDVRVKYGWQNVWWGQLCSFWSSPRQTSVILRHWWRLRALMVIVNSCWLAAGPWDSVAEWSRQGMLWVHIVFMVVEVYSRNLLQRQGLGQKVQFASRDGPGNPQGHGPGLFVPRS